MHRYGVGTVESGEDGSKGSSATTYGGAAGGACHGGGARAAGQPNYTPGVDGPGVGSGGSAGTSCQGGHDGGAVRVVESIQS